MSDVSFLSGMAGAGLQEMDSSVQGTPWLNVTQPLSEVVSAGTVKVGHFYNSSLQKDYGQTVRIVPVEFKKSWVERTVDGTFVARYLPHSIEVEGDVYKGMINPVSKNKIQENWLYLVINADSPEDGYMLYSVSGGGFKYARKWNNRTFNTFLPDGNKAPLFAHVWKLTATEAIGKASGKKFYTVTSYEEEEWIPEELFKTAVQRAIASKDVLQIAAPMSPEEFNSDEEVA